MLVLEYMEGGDLYQAIQENSYPVDTGLLSWYQKGSTIALDIIKGLVFLHSREVSHTLHATQSYSRTWATCPAPVLESQIQHYRVTVIIAVADMSIEQSAYSASLGKPGYIVQIPLQMRSDV